MTLSSDENEHHSFLTESQIEARIRSHAFFRGFWNGHAPLLIFRSRPTRDDPIYEIQLVWDLVDRLETFAWVWLDAIGGEILKQFPE